MNRKTTLNKKDSKPLRNQKEKNDNSFEKYKDYINKKDKFEENNNSTKEAFGDGIGIKKDRRDNKLKKDELSNNADLLPTIIEQEKAKWDIKELKNAATNHKLQAKNERSFSTEKPIDSTNSNGALSPYFEIVNGSENKQEKLCYPQNYKDNEEAKFRTIKTITTTDDSKKNIMEVASYKLENLNYQAAACNVKANINNPDSNSPNNKASCTRYINPITNNIHSIEDIELLDKKSKNIKLLKPFTPHTITNILVNQVNYQTQNKSNLKNNKNHINNNLLTTIKKLVRRKLLMLILSALEKKAIWTLAVESIKF